MNISVKDLDRYLDLVIGLVIGYVPTLLLALLTLIVGFRVIHFITRTVRKALERREIDPSLTGFIGSLCDIALKVMLAISVAGMVGVEMTSFVAVLASAGLAIGLALSGTLQNFAGGVLILILKPYRVGDFIEAAGFMGTVQEIQIFNTLLTSPDNKRIIIPNTSLANGAIVNYSAEPIRRIEWIFGVGYSDNIEIVKSILLDLLKSDERILAEPETYVGLSQLADSSVNFTVRAWVESADFLDVTHTMNERVKMKFDAEGISIPYPQRDVHIHQNTQ